MSLDTKSRWGRVRAGRVRILWLFLGAFLLVSTLPIGLYHRQVLQLSQDKLVDTERVQQTDLTRSLAQEIQQFESNLTQQLLSERQRSEEHTSELQSPCNLVCRLLLEKKKRESHRSTRSQ